LVDATNTATISVTVGRFIPPKHLADLTGATFSAVADLTGATFSAVPLRNC